MKRPKESDFYPNVDAYIIAINKYIDHLESEEKGQKPPNLATLTTYFRMNGYKESAAKKAFDYYENLKGNGRIWRDVKGNPIKNWKLKMKAVWFKPENKIQNEIQRGF